MSKTKTILLVVGCLALLSILGIGGIIAAVVVPNIAKVKEAADEAKAQMVAAEKAVKKAAPSVAQAKDNKFEFKKPGNTTPKPAVKSVAKSASKVMAEAPIKKPIAVAVKPVQKVSQPAASESLFNFHIEHSKDVADKQKYWSTMSKTSWENFLVQYNSAINSKETSLNERQKLKSYMTVASYLRGEYEQMTVQLIELNSKVDPSTISQLGVSQSEFLTGVRKLVGQNNVKLAR